MTATANRETMTSDYWRSSEYKTYGELIRAAMAYHGIATDTELARRSETRDPNRRGINRTTFRDIIQGKRSELQERTVDILVATLGIPAWRWRQVSATRALTEQLEKAWRPPTQAQSPFLTPRSKDVLSDLIRALHEQSADSYERGQRDLLHRLADAGIDTSGMDAHVVPAPVAGTMPDDFGVADGEPAE